MMRSTDRKPDAPAIRWGWIQSRRDDLLWYIGSAVAGWIYVVTVLTVARGLEDPIRDPFYTIQIGGTSIALTLGLVVVASWSVLIDAPHVWATLARTWLDPEEWRERRGMLLSSLVWFSVGPIVVFGPYLLGAIGGWSSETMALGSHLFFVFFRLWAYYHVVRQHWGFLVLYKRRNDDWKDPLENRADSWFFNASLYLPLALFMTSPWYAESGMPSLGLEEPLWREYSVGSLLFPVVVAAFVLALLLYSTFQLQRLRAGIPRNGPKLLLLLSIVPLHLVVFAHPLLALFVIPIVTVGHNLQYHRIVWAFGRNKYFSERAPRFRLPRAAFRSVPLYLAFGLAFTLLCYQGPWVAIVKQNLSHVFDDWILAGVGMVAGVTPPETAGLGAQITATLFLGWAMQHYYLDAKIWRIRRDPKVAQYLRLS